MSKIEIFINNKSILATVGSTILQTALSNNIKIPSFCYHESLSIAGSCRMCLVEVEKQPKLVASCAFPVFPNMRIQTESKVVKKARENVLEFLLINHPLDCAICDQGGECDLQEQTKSYGSDRGRFFESKRSVEDKYFNPLIKTIMTRCIHCTRCIRFASEVALVPAIGTTGRGMETEISTYIRKIWENSYISGNLVDICPVGALTSAPNSFSFRSWELQSIETIDLLDKLHSGIRVDRSTFDLVRILPKRTFGVNGNWITDKARYLSEGNKNQRLTNPLIRKNRNSKFEEVSWDLLYRTISELIFSRKIKGFVGPFASMETSWMFSKIVDLNEGNIHTKFIPESAADYICDLKKYEDIFFLGSIPQLENPLYLAELNKSKKNIFIFSDIQFKEWSELDSWESNYPNVFLAGGHVNTLIQFLKCKHFFSEYLMTSKTPVLVCGNNISKTLGKEITNLVKYLNKNFNKNIDIVAANFPESGSNNIFESGAIYKEKSFFKDLRKNLFWLVGYDEKLNYSDDDIIIYQGHHADEGANMANIVIPSNSFLESKGTYINTFGLIQEIAPSIEALPSLKDDASIFLKIFKYITTGVLLEESFFDSKMNTLFKNTFKHIKSCKVLERIPSKNVGQSFKISKCISSGSSPITNYFRDNVFSRNSKVMSECASIEHDFIKKTF